MKILIVDDSIVFRTAIAQALSDVDGLEIYKSVSNGRLALDELAKPNDIDLITLDMEMPIMDGMDTVREIRKINKMVRIIIFSSSTLSGAEKTIEVLKLGANDFVRKIQGNGTIDNSIKMIKEELTPKIRALLQFQSVGATPFEKASNGRGINSENNDFKAGEDFSQSSRSHLDVDAILSEIRHKPDIIILASSTGGPNALSEFFSGLDHPITIPMLLVQHMPPIFTTKLADALTKQSPVKVVEAKTGDTLKPGVCYLAPGDYHMVVNSDLTLSLNQSEKVCFVRPSADVLFTSVYKNFRKRILCIVMTGMGSDGKNGCLKLCERNVNIIVQDESTSIVWGMPGAVVRSGVNPFVLPLSKFSQIVNKVSQLK